MCDHALMVGGAISCMLGLLLVGIYLSFPQHMPDANMFRCISGRSVLASGGQSLICVTPPHRLAAFQLGWMQCSLCGVCRATMPIGTLVADEFKLGPAEVGLHPASQPVYSVCWAPPDKGCLGPVSLPQNVKQRVDWPGTGSIPCRTKHAFLSNEGADGYTAWQMS